MLSTISKAGLHTVSSSRRRLLLSLRACLSLPNPMCAIVRCMRILMWRPFSAAEMDITAIRRSRDVLTSDESLYTLSSLSQNRAAGTQRGSPQSLAQLRCLRYRFQAVCGDAFQIPLIDHRRHLHLAAARRAAPHYYITARRWDHTWIEPDCFFWGILAQITLLCTSPSSVSGRRVSITQSDYGIISHLVPDSQDAYQ